MDPAPRPPSPEDRLARRVHSVAAASFQNPLQAKTALAQDGWTLQGMGPRPLLKHRSGDERYIMAGRMPKPAWMRFIDQNASEPAVNITLLLRDDGAYTLESVCSSVRGPDGVTYSAVLGPDGALSFDQWRDNVPLPGTRTVRLAPDEHRGSCPRLIGRAVFPQCPPEQVARLADPIREIVVPVAC